MIKHGPDKRVRPLHALGFFLLFFAVSCGFTASQELIVNTPGFKPAYLTLGHSLTYSGFAAAELARDGWPERKAPLKDYAIVSVFCFLSAFLANNALTYIDYSTRVMIKCMKPVPTMALSVLYVGADRTRYTPLEWAAAFILGVGLADAIMGESQAGVHVSTFRMAFGVGMAVSSICSDALVSVYEQAKVFSRDPKPTPAELLLYTWGFSALGALAAFIQYGEPHIAYEFVSREPSILGQMLLSEILGYASVSCVVRLVEHFGATNAELVKTVRRGCIVAFSYVVIEGKRPKTGHYRGAFVFFAGALLSIYAKRKKRLARASADAPSQPPPPRTESA